jgi:hypothetical protein
MTNSSKVYLRLAFKVDHLKQYHAKCLKLDHKHSHNRFQMLLSLLKKKIAMVIRNPQFFTKLSRIALMTAKLLQRL